METFFARVAARVIVGLIVAGVLYWQHGNGGNQSAAPTFRPPRVSVVATASPASARPAPSAQSPTDGRLDALWAVISNPGLSYHLSGEGVSKANGEVVERFTLALDITADDYRGSVNSIGGSGRAQLVRKDGVVYLRTSKRPWAGRRIDTDSVLQFIPFLNIRDKNNLVADGIVKHGRKTLYRYVSTDAYRPDVAHMMDLARFSGTCQVLRLELLVTEDAIPVSAHFNCEINNDVYSGNADYAFSQFGKRFRIEAPIEPPS